MRLVVGELGGERVCTILIDLGEEVVLEVAAFLEIAGVLEERREVCARVWTATEA